MKLIGIVSDNYKIKTFEKELKEKGFTDFKTAPYKNDTSLITVDVDENKIEKFVNLTQSVEFNFKYKNKA